MMEKLGKFVEEFGENHGKWRKKLRIFDYFNGKGGCLKGRRGQRKDEKASKNFSTGTGARWEKKGEILKEKVGWKRVGDLRKGGSGERRGNFKGKSWMEKGGRFEKGGSGGKVKRGRWIFCFLLKRDEKASKFSQRGRGLVGKKRDEIER